MSDTDLRDIKSKDISLQPLRIPSGWKVDWNTWLELDPTPENVSQGFFGGSSLFAASNEGLRLAVDLEWRPEDDPVGQYELVVYYIPWERTPKGRRRKNVPLDFRRAKVVLKFETRSREQIVKNIEDVLKGRPEWVEHN